MSVATGVYNALLGSYVGGLFWGGIQSRYYYPAKKQCKANSDGFDMWYIRMLITDEPYYWEYLWQKDYMVCHILLSCFF